MGKDIEVAILFADVVGSTQLYEQLGDLKAREMVGRCLDIMRDATEANHGTVIKTMGDEVMSTFPTRRRCDERRRRRCRSRSRPTRAQAHDGRPVAIRIGCHWPGRAREARHVRLGRAHRQSHDEPGQGRADHHHARDRRAAVARVACVGAPDRHRDDRGRATRSRSTKCCGRPRKSPACCRRLRAARSASARPKRLRLRYQGREVTVDEGRKSVDDRPRRGQRRRRQGQSDLARACAHRDRPQQIHADRPEHQRHVRADSGRRRDPSSAATACRSRARG